VVVVVAAAAAAVVRNDRICVYVCDYILFACIFRILANFRRGFLNPFSWKGLGFLDGGSDFVKASIFTA
jgi:hypothetical protein